MAYNDRACVALKIATRNAEDVELLDTFQKQIQKNVSLRTEKRESETGSFIFVYNHDISQRKNEITSNVKELRFIQEALYGIQTEEQESLLLLLKGKKILIDMFPIHNKQDKKLLKRKWVWNFLRLQPIYLIKEYYGAEIASYFAWLGYHTTSLLLPTSMSFLIVLSGNYCTPSFSLASFLQVTAIFSWASGVIQSWDRINRKDSNAADISTAGERVLRIDHKSGCNRFGKVKQGVSIILTFMCFLALLFVTITILDMKIETDNWDIPELMSKTMKRIPEMLTALLILVYDFVFTRIAKKLTAWEDYKYMEEHEASLISKLIVFKMFNYFHTLIYVALKLQDLERLQTLIQNYMIVQQIKFNVGEVFGNSLRVKVTQITVAVIVCGVIKDGALIFSTKLIVMITIALPFYYFMKPCITSKFIKSWFFKKESQKNLESYEKEYQMSKCESSHYDYLEMLVQFGYITLFGPIYPLTTIFAIVNNLLQIHTDAFKYVHVMQRPFPTNNTFTNFWRFAFAVVTGIAVLFNSQIAHISGFFGSDPPLGRAMFLFGILYGVIHYATYKFLSGVFSKVDEPLKHD